MTDAAMNRGRKTFDRLVDMATSQPDKFTVTVCDDFNLRFKRDGQMFTYFCVEPTDVEQ